MLRGLRFQRRIRLAPGVRVNLSRSGASASLGPRGADVNIGPHGASANAGIPGTGLSWRRKLGVHGGWLGVVLLVGGLAFWAGKHQSGIGNLIAPAAISGPAAGAAPAAEDATASPVRHARRASRAPLQPGPVFVHREGSVLREEAKTSGKKLKKESKGAQVMLLSESDGWAKVTDGNITGYMRASVLGATP
ncbi:MAG TPA: DUF4236 domain-containing protein [Rhizomicrobium sp.]|nr:DUF4236 domain-containing protein [Rhizomicrobium sp.]